MKNHHDTSVDCLMTGALLKPQIQESGTLTGRASRRFLECVSCAERGRGMELFIDLKMQEKALCKVISNTGADLEDYRWIFSSCAGCLETDSPAFTELSENGSFPYVFIDEKEEETRGSSQYMDDLSLALKSTGARLFIRAVKGEGKETECRAGLVLDMPAPLRLKALLERYFLKMKMVPCSLDEDNGGPAGRIPVSSAGAFIELILDLACRMEKTEKELERKRAASSEWSGEIEDMGLSLRSINCLRRAGIHTYEELQDLTEEDLERIRNLGRKSLQEILEKTEEYRGRPLIKPEVPVREDYSAMLESLVGLSLVKRQVRRIRALSLLKKDLEEKRKGAEPICLNMGFVGNPGTAKTTAARILAGILYEAGILKSPDIMEVGRGDLIGRYTGETAGKVQQVFSLSEGRLLFVDEAYALLDAHEGSYGDEAINTLVQEMENRRDSTVVVFAGYPGRMEDFFKRNPGLRSRVPFILRFDDYCLEDLLAIADLEAEKKGFQISPCARERVREICASSMKKKDFGNGRFCRNLVEDAILSYAERRWDKEPAQRSAMPFVLMAEDFAHFPAWEGPAERRMGFY